MLVPTFVDLQGFIVNKKFIVKEVAVLKQGNVLTHYIFTSSVPWKFLIRSDRSCASRLTAYHHGLRWEDRMVPIEHRKMRLLGRRYDLTTTGYKFLEIGINVGPPSYVEIALRDHRGHELLLSLETWKGLYEQR
ncbi:hypothetical protein G5I_13291 [Acromyrmex echinatior]|uniref:Uncharacterized protein n=1 Tax=Acromyrmex echinatior TaxID=103372 RepID=F4X4M5_ACREC|nr:hypothetical protein G5I_13291 [Acromyrmex echinatior]